MLKNLRLSGPWGAALVLSLALGLSDRTAASETPPLPYEVSYAGEASEPLQRGDWYAPEGAGPHPAVVLVHGGGWVRGERSQMAGIARSLQAAGFAVLNIDYRLAPQHPYPAAVDDVQTALRWLYEQAPGLKVDRQRLSLWGYSAGAHLVALLGARADAQTPPLAAVIAGGLPADLPPIAGSQLVQQFMGATLAEQPQRYEQASPLRQVHAGSTPMLLYHGSWDWVVRPTYSEQMAAALRARGVEAELQLLPARGHIAAFFFDGAARERALAFLQRHRSASVAGG